MQLLFLLLLLVVPYLILTLTARWFSGLNIASAARPRRPLTLLRFHVPRPLHQNRRDVRDAAAVRPVPQRADLSDGRAGTARGDRRVDSASDESDGFVPHLNAHRDSPG